MHKYIMTSCMQGCIYSTGTFNKSMPTVEPEGDLWVHIGWALGSSTYISRYEYNNTQRTSISARGPANKSHVDTIALHLSWDFVFASL